MLDKKPETLFEVRPHWLPLALCMKGHGTYVGIRGPPVGVSSLHLSLSSAVVGLSFQPAPSPILFVLKQNISNPNAVVAAPLELQGTASETP